MTSRARRCLLAAALTSTLLLSARPAGAYSVLAHEAMVDALWEDRIVPLLRTRFPGAPPDTLTRARAYAYGGSVIQDLGYYPFGSRFFSNLVHYVRSGDLVEALIREARDPNEYAFALGALAHYASDNAGHPLGTNRAVPLVHPKLPAEFGEEVLYAHSPSRHVMVLIMQCNHSITQCNCPITQFLNSSIPQLLNAVRRSTCVAPPRPW